jgi:hypothetical protein
MGLDFVGISWDPPGKAYFLCVFFGLLDFFGSFRSFFLVRLAQGLVNSEGFLKNTNFVKTHENGRFCQIWWFMGYNTGVWGQNWD